MIYLDHLAVEGIVPVTLHLAPGEVGVLVMPSQGACEAMLSALLGLTPAAAGSSRLLDQDISTLPPREAQGIFQRVGVAWREGGLVSNLSLGKNAALPTTYHGRPRKTVEERAPRLLRAIGLSTDVAFLGQLPANVSSWQRRLVGLVRAWLMEPEVMVYDGLLEDLPSGRPAQVAAAAVNHQRDTGYTALHLVTDRAAAAILSADRVVEVSRDDSRPAAELSSSKAEDG